MRPCHFAAVIAVGFVLPLMCRELKSPFKKRPLHSSIRNVLLAYPLQAGGAQRTLRRSEARDVIHLQQFRINIDDDTKNLVE
jgi:hypothetical protein